MLDREAVVRLAAVLCCARLVACECPADGEGVTHTNSLFDESTQTFQPIAGPRFPPISIRQTRTFGAVGSCVGSLSADGFDGGEIVVAATNALTSMDSYGTIMRYTAEIFLDWLNSERRIELPDGTVLTGGLMVDGKRYSLRFAWTDDFQQPAEAAISLDMRRQDLPGVATAARCPRRRRARPSWTTCAQSSQRLFGGAILFFRIKRSFAKTGSGHTQRRKI
jgi:hypothetical protein